MRSDVVERLLEINENFYAGLARPFARTRARPQPGFERLLDYVPVGPGRLLDLGCGEGRFGRFFLAHFPAVDYVGVDASAPLLERAHQTLPGRFYQRNLMDEGALRGLGRFDVVSLLAVLQHIPGHANRLRLLRTIAGHMRAKGRLFVSTWQFMDSARQRRKLVDWSEVALTPDDVEGGDYLLTWRSGGFGIRYVAYIDPQEMHELTTAAGYGVVDQFRSDGKEGDLNLYTVLEPLGDNSA
ncbi:MAG TPA: class I SAM-dependent methyltransferase [Candidatus Sulfomarinibacteraceae bacterium]|nr:class I SAM-dependent methyltransferase [Candidatus Sulfomarinibacteraceae bacterium]